MTEKSDSQSSLAASLIARIKNNNIEEDTGLFTEVRFNTPFLLTKNSLYFIYPDETLHTAGYTAAESLVSHNEACIELTEDSKKAQLEEGIVDTGLIFVFAVFLFFAYFFGLFAGIFWGCGIAFLLLLVVLALEYFISNEMPEAPMDDFWLANECLKKYEVSLEEYKSKITEEVFNETFSETEKADKNSIISFAIEQNENGLFYGKIMCENFEKK